MDPIHHYFDAEQAESLVFMAAALAALGMAAWGWLWRRTPWARGLGASLLLVGALQGVVGYTIYQRSPLDAARVAQHQATQPARLQTEEVPRMQVVMRNFRLYLAVELALLALAVVAAWRSRPGGWVHGAAWGLGLQAAFTAVLDLIASQRGAVYLDWLRSQS